jgi:hypothetical protein
MRLATAIVVIVLLGLALPVRGKEEPVRSVPSPAGAGSGMYNLSTGGDGHVYLSWLEPLADGGQTLRFSRWKAGAWEPAREVARAANWFVNWADHPSVTAAADGRLYAHWLAYTGKRTGSYGYGIRVATSSDGGQLWSPVFDEGSRNVTDYSGFITFLPTPQGTSAVFLTPLAPDDGASEPGKPVKHVKTLGIVTFGPDGREASRRIVDADTCSCCSTDMAATAAGPVAVYRDREPGEVRDVSIVRLIDGKWSEPRTVHRDGWVINGCPTNGPAIAARGPHVAVTWFTAAGDHPIVYAAFSRDSGATFSAPVQIDDGSPVGWPDVVMSGDGQTFVSWLERTTGGNGEIRIRQVSAERRGAAVTVSTTAAGRATGIPMMVPSPQGLMIAWRRDSVQTALVNPAAIPKP